MKKYIVAFAAIALCATSCSEAFFDRFPTDEMSPDNYMRNISEVESVLTAAYGGMRGSYGDGIVYIGDLPTDNAYDYKLNNSSAHITMHESNMDSQNSIISNLWYACYQVINRCSLVEEAMNSKFPDDESYDELVGQARFLRGYTYYLMVRVWGGVPLVVSDIKDYMTVFEYGRETEEKVYEQIIDDLEAAEGMLPDFWPAADKGRVTATAAQAMLGDVYLTLGEYSTAKEWFKKVMDKEGAELGLLDDYASIFDSNNANNKEVIFSIQYAHNQTPSMRNYLGPASLGNIQGQPVDPDGTGSQIYGVNILMMTHELEAKFSSDDKRRSVVFTGVSSPDYQCTIPMTLKYFDRQNVIDGNSGNSPDCGCHTIISRYSDVLLKYAECLAAEGDYEGAVAQLARVRTRAGLDTDVALNADAVAKAIADERQLELCMEGHRWFDLKRTGKLLEVMNEFYSRVNAPDLHETILMYEYGDNTSISEYELVFPLPYAQVELNKDKLVQNPEWK